MGFELPKATLSARFAGWWSAWKYVVILLVLLAGSAWLNLHLYVRLQTQPLRAEVASKDQALQVSATLLGGALQSAQVLGDAARRTTANLTESSGQYRDAARLHPLAPICAPGQGRQDAVNRTLGAPQPPEKKR